MRFSPYAADQAMLTGKGRPGRRLSQALAGLALLVGASLSGASLSGSAAASPALAAALPGSAPLAGAPLTGPILVNSEEPVRGPVTNLPIPRYVSLKGSEGNARRGPSTSHRIDWVFIRRDMPLQVIGEYENWRQVRDREGATGWVHYTLLSGVRTVIVDYDMVPLRSSPQDAGAVVAHLESGVIARLGSCIPDWCRVSIDGYRGWLRKSALWGVDPDEIRD